MSGLQSPPLVVATPRPTYSQSAILLFFPSAESQTDKKITWIMHELLMEQTFLFIQRFNFWIVTL